MNFLIEALKSVNAQDDPTKFIIEGPPTEELTGEINIDNMAHNFIKDTGYYWDCYQKQRKEGVQHSLAWDACGCHLAPMEMQNILRREIEKEDKNFFKEAHIPGAEYFDFEKVSYVERTKPFSKRRFRTNRRMKRSMPSFAQKRAFLVSCGIEDEIVNKAAESADSIGFDLVINTEGHPIDEVLKELAESGLRVEHQTLKMQDNTHSVRCSTPMKRKASLAERRLCIIGIPSEKRRYIAERLSSYYNVDLLTTDEMIKSIMERGVVDEKDMDIGAFSTELMQLAYLDVVNSHPGYVLEGYPMTRGQAEALEDDEVVFIDMDIEQFSKFQSDKRWCPVCMLSYHLTQQPPIDPLKCDRCGTTLTIRPEDLPKTVKDRYFQYRVSMNDTLEHLRKTDSLIEVDPQHDGEKSVVIIERILKGEKKRTEYKGKNESIKR